MIGDSLSPEIEGIATQIVDAAFKVHSETGPGLLENLCETCLACELRNRGLGVRRQVVVPLCYDGVQLDADLRIDLLVEELIIIEVKAVEKMIPLFDAQVLTYLKLTNKPLGFLINFNVRVIANGIKRIILTDRQPFDADEP
jgi:GxxExxY protein